MNHFDYKKESESDGAEEIYSKIVRAGRRTYFFDVKATRNDDYYVTVTESRKKTEKDGKFSFEKHKITPLQGGLLQIRGRTRRSGRVHPGAQAGVFQSGRLGDQQHPRVAGRRIRQTVTHDNENKGVRKRSGRFFHSV